MNKDNTKNVTIVIIIVIIGIISYFMFIKKTPNLVIVSPVVNQPAASLTYSNFDYGFSFNLPLSWKGYSIIEENWEGNMIDGTIRKISGSKIIIRHPLWTEEVLMQDIPIMVFTLSQWDLIREEKLSVGAAPIGPSELGRNKNYVFAIPARYNFAYPLGFEEVQKIIENKPFLAI